MTDSEYGPGPGPLDDPDRWEAQVRAITEAAAPELARLRKETSLTAVISQWRRPVISTAVTIAAISAVSLSLLMRSPADTSEEAPLLAEAMLPESVAAWMETGEALTLAELVAAIEEGR